MSLNLANTEHSEVFTTSNDSKLLKFETLLNSTAFTNTSLRSVSFSVFVHYFAAMRSDLYARN